MHCIKLIQLDGTLTKKREKGSPTRGSRNSIIDINFSEREKLDGLTRLLRQKEENTGNMFGATLAHRQKLLNVFSH